MTDIIFKEKDKPEKLSVDVDCTFNFRDKEEKENVIADLKHNGWMCLNELGRYLEEH